MEAKLALCLILAIVSTEWYGVVSFSGGAPSQACSTISPDPSQHLAPPQTSQVPYNIGISQLSDAGGYTPGQTYSLTFSGNSGEQFRGVLVLSRRVADNSPVGTFTDTDANTRLSSCSPSTSGITHSNRDVKMSVSFQWMAPPQGTGSIQFRFAVVQERSTYWAAQSSAVIQELVAVTEEATTAADSVTSTGAPPNTDAPTSIGVPTSTGAPTGMITMMTTDTGATSGQSGGATDMQGGEMTTSPAEQAQTVPRSSAMKQSAGARFWTLAFLMIAVGKTIIRVL